MPAFSSGELVAQVGDARKDQILGTLIQAEDQKLLAVFDRAEQHVGVIRQTTAWGGWVHLPDGKQVGKFGPPSPIQAFKLARRMADIRDEERRQTGVSTLGQKCLSVVSYMDHPVGIVVDIPGNLFTAVAIPDYPKLGPPAGALGVARPNSPYHLGAAGAAFFLLLTNYYAD